MRHVGRRRALVLAAVIGALGGVAAGRFRRMEVSGDSMLPAFAPGDRVLVFRGSRIRTGDVVACVDPRDRARTMVKRVAAVTTGPGYMVMGDNASASTDSRHFGLIDNEQIIGRVLYRYFPSNRAGLLPRSARFVPKTGDEYARSVKNWW